MYLQHVMYLFHYHCLLCDLEKVKCKLVKVHCDRYAFNLKNQHPFSVMMTVIYIYNAYINIYKGMYYCIKIQKEKMAAVCLWLIENKNLQMYSVVSCEFVQVLSSEMKTL